MVHGLQARDNKEIKSCCQQSVDDLEANYHSKGAGRYKDYGANLTEACGPENELRLIAKVQVAPNNIDDGHLLAETLPSLRERTAMDTLITGGGFASEVSDIALQGLAVNHVQTALRGVQPSLRKFNLADFSLHQGQQDNPIVMTYPRNMQFVK